VIKRTYSFVKVRLGLGGLETLVLPKVNNSFTSVVKISKDRGKCLGGGRGRMIKKKKTRETNLGKCVLWSKKRSMGEL